jgi:hypothetical protein
MLQVRNSFQEVDIFCDGVSASVEYIAGTFENALSAEMSPRKRYNIVPDSCSGAERRTLSREGRPP